MHVTIESTYLIARGNRVHVTIESTYLIARGNRVHVTIESTYLITGACDNREYTPHYM